MKWHSSGRQGCSACGLKGSMFVSEQSGQRGMRLLAPMRRVGGRRRSAAAAEAQRAAHAPHGTRLSGRWRDAAVHWLARRRGRQGLQQVGRGGRERGRHRHEKQCQELARRLHRCGYPRPCNTRRPDRHSQQRADAAPSAAALTGAATGDLPPEDLKLGD